MYSLRSFYKTSIITALVTTSLLFADSARANVYATDIKLNSTQTGTVNTTQGSSVAISYILNDNATAGVTIKIYDSTGTNVVRTIAIPSGLGTVKGSNNVAWDGKNDSAQNVAVGSYSVSVTAAHSGYSNWTVTTDNTSPSTYSFQPYGIAANRNINSPYYGRVFVAVSSTKAGASVVGDTQGIIKCNADGTYAADGAFSRFDYAWVDDGGDSPIMLHTFADDRLYFNDWTGQGKIVSVDMALTKSFVVWDTPNYANNLYSTAGNWVDYDIAFVGTDHPQLFEASLNFPNNAGIFMWLLTNDVTTSNLFADPTLTTTNGYDGSAGQQVVQTSGDLSLRADGVIVDANTNIYCLQNRGNPGDQNMRACMFPTWNETDVLFTGAAWIVGGGDDTFRNLRGFALDSRTNPKYLAVSEYTSGAADTNGFIGGGIRILNPTNGSTLFTNLFVTNFYRSVAWDNVGNLYAGTSAAVGSVRSRWQAISPPGPNQATTPALAVVQVAAGVTAPHITSINYNNGVVTINFTGATTDLATSFSLQSSSTVNGTFANVLGAVATSNGPGSFTFTTPASGSTQFYRISR